MSNNANGYEDITSVHILRKRQIMQMVMKILLLFIFCANDAKRYKWLWRHYFCSYSAQTTPNNINGYECITSVHILRRRRQTMQMVMKILLLFIFCAKDAKRYKWLWRHYFCSYPAQTTPNNINGYEYITSVHILRKRRKKIQMGMKTLLLFIFCADDAKRYKWLWRHYFCSYPAQTTPNNINGYEDITSDHILCKRRQTIQMVMKTILLFIS